MDILIIKLNIKNEIEYVLRRIKKMYFYKFIAIEFNRNTNYELNNDYPYIKIGSENNQKRVDKIFNNIKNNIRSDFTNNIQLRIRQDDFFDYIQFVHYGGESEKLIAILSDWKKKYADYTIWPYTEPLENSIRLNNLIWLFHYLSRNLPEKDIRFFLSFVYMLAEFLYWFLEKHLRNNHTLIEAKNLYLTSLFFSNSRFTTKWRKKAQKVLIQCLKHQIDECGVHIERSSMYQKVLYSELLELASFIHNYPKLVDNRFKKLLWTKIGMMNTYDQIMTYKNGNYPIFGDGFVGDRLIRFIPITDNEKISDYKKELQYWQSHIDIPAIVFKRENQSILKNYSGFIYSTTEKTQLIINAGMQLSKQNFAKGHLHSDYLSFVLVHNDQEIIAHSGTYDYSRESIPWFRGTRGHNTIMIDDLEQHGNQDGSKSGHYADGFVDQCETIDGKDHINIHHIGYQRIGVLHKRYFVHDRENHEIEIIDTLVSHNSHNFVYYLHFGESVQCKVTDNRYVQIKDVGIVEFEFPENVQMKLYFGEEYPGAFCSKEYHKKTPIFLLKLSGDFFKQCELKTTIQLN